MCNNILLSGKYPECWRQGIIFNIFKFGDYYNPNNYRGITINSVLGKLFGIILKVRLEKFAEENQLIDTKQIGFRQKARTADHMFVLDTLYKKYVKQNRPLFLCFTDFRKAYDKVWRSGLLLRLLEGGISGPFYNIIEDMYKYNISCVRNVDVLGDCFHSNVCVRQGDVLSPLLFNIYINDITKYIGEGNAPSLDGVVVNSLLYADDLVILSTDEMDLQDKLNKLVDFCDEWQLEINEEKSKIIEMRKRGSGRGESMLIKEKYMIEYVAEYKYLGVVITEKGYNKTSVTNIKDRSLKAIFKLCGALSHCYVRPKFRLSLFDKVIKPIACYGGEILGQYMWRQRFLDKDTAWKRLDENDIEKVHRKFGRITLSVHSKTSNAATMGELGRFPIMISIIMSVMNYWNHILLNRENKLLQVAYREDVAWDNAGKDM